MKWHVSTVTPTVTEKDKQTLLVQFADGLTGRVVFGPEFFTGVFAPLRDPAVFNQVFVDHGAVAWPGDVDFAPDAMYDEIKRHGVWVLTGAKLDVSA
jgi:Protein of unknown function (DUF2442)